MAVLLYLHESMYHSYCSTFFGLLSAVEISKRVSSIARHVMMRLNRLYHIRKFIFRK